jgi:hypothetical protein
MQREFDCASYPRTLMVTIASNGVRHYHLRCVRCRGVHGDGAVPHGDTLLQLIDLASVPVYSDAGEWAATCERCGAHYAELHHWAPWHLFEDANEWPTAWLCRDCHTLWHSIVTPEMHRKRTA